MKQFIFSVTLISIAIISFSFINYNHNSKNDRESDWCVQILCTGKSFLVTVIATGPITAKEAARRIYPKCKTTGKAPTQGKCE